MNMRQLMYSDRLQIIVFLALFLAPILLQFMIAAGTDNEAYGFPLPFMQRITYQCVIGGYCPPSHFGFQGWSLAADVAILYLATAFILYLLTNKFVQTLDRIIQAFFLAFSLFFLFMIISIIFSVGYPLMKSMTAFGLPLAFVAHDSWGGPGSDSFILWTFLALDIVFWLAISVFILHTKDRIGSRAKS